MYKSEQIVIFCFDRTGAYVFFLLEEINIEKCRAVMNRMIEKFGGTPEFLIFTLDAFLHKKTGIENMNSFVDVILEEDFEDLNIQDINLYEKSREDLLTKLIESLFDTSFCPNEWELKFLKEQGLHVLKISQ